MLYQVAKLNRTSINGRELVLEWISGKTKRVRSPPKRRGTTMNGKDEIFNSVGKGGF